MLQRQATTPLVEMFGIDIDAITIDEAVQQLGQWIAAPNGNCHYVVTPNVDHLVQLREQPQFRATYDDAAMVVADGLPLVIVSQLFGERIPERVAGSDLVPALLAAAKKDRPTKVFLLGAASGVAEQAAQNIETRWPAVRVTGLYSPPIGFEKDERENQIILDKIQQAQPDVLVIGLGAPKQELWVHAHSAQLQVPVALCAGATIDFLAGHRQRAPRWIQKIGLEWCHRMFSDPRRLVGRYARDAWIFPQLIWHEWRTRRTN